MAYEACEKQSKLFGKHPFQFRSATNLITLLVLIHLAQLLFLFFGIPYTNDTTYGGLIFLSLFALTFLIGFFVDKTFSKEVLARAIKNYQNESLFRYSKLIMFSYLILNLLVLSLIVIN